MNTAEIIERLERPGVKSVQAFTMTEALVAMALSALLVGGIINGFVQSTRTAEWSAYNLAANSLALQGLEQVRAAKWDPHDYRFPGGVDQVIASNFPPQTNVLDIPISRTNLVFATNRFTITTLSTNPPLKLIQVDCTWRFVNGRVYTNSVTTCRTADQ